jgi:hypothetical protein
MNRFGLRGSLIAFTALVGLALTPSFAFAQHGGGGGHSGGGGGGFHGGGGSYGGGSFHGGGSYGGGSYGGSRGVEGGYRGGEGASRGGGFEGGASRGGYSRGGSEAGRGSSSEASRSSNIRPAINDGQWHSFGNGASASHTTSAASANSGRGSTAAGNSNLMARNAGTSDGAWHSFGGSRSEAGLVGGTTRGGSEFNRGYGYGGYGYRGGWGGYGWGGYGWRGGWGCCGWGWGGLGFGWGFWGFGFGWPYWGWGWGPAWGAWGPYGYNPYWYAPLAYNYGYPDYSLDWSNNPPPYRPDAAPSTQGSQQQDSADDWIAPSSDSSLVPDSGM